jgi:hypothetical protein
MHERLDSIGLCPVLLGFFDVASSMRYSVLCVLCGKKTSGLDRYDAAIANVPDQARRANGVQLLTEARSRRCLQPVGSKLLAPNQCDNPERANPGGSQEATEETENSRPIPLRCLR